MHRHSLIAAIAAASILTAGPLAAGNEAKTKAHAHDHPHTIVDVAAEAGSFKTLIAAVQAAGLVDALKGEGPFTVFAPTDEAFAKLPEGTIAELLKPENKERLTAILTYHVVPGKVMAADVVKLEKAKTLQGQNVSISMEKDVVKINGATVVATDIAADNGVIHVIDTVILPQDS